MLTITIKNAHKISKILSNFICKNNQFSACFNFEQMHTATIFGEQWYNGSYTVMAKPIQSEL